VGEADGLDRLLVTLKLERFRDAFAKHEITRDNIEFVEEGDLADVLPLGPRRQLWAYITALRRARDTTSPEAASRPPPPSCLSQSFRTTITHASSSPEENNPYSCLICCDAERSVCFVPCGHVVSCKVRNTHTLPRRGLD
jgi:hypothetical protein